MRKRNHQSRILRNDLHRAHCGYDLRGLDQFRCPECGASFDPRGGNIDYAWVGTMKTITLMVITHVPIVTAVLIVLAIIEVFGSGRIARLSALEFLLLSALLVVLPVSAVTCAIVRAQIDLIGARRPRAWKRYRWRAHWIALRYAVAFCFIQLLIALTAFVLLAAVPLW